ncbi:MAG: hypothetical protein HY900_31000, partial [Deltaproteobacteria bacterium]|nr:hypothetical protein [Deltaproteobacteria bacterium]
AGHNRIRGTVIRARGDLLPKQRVALFVAAGDGSRFKRLFRETWKRIPLGSRRALCKLWRNIPPEWSLAHRVEVVLDAPCNVNATRHPDGWAYARCHRDLPSIHGRVFSFSGPHLDEMPDEEARVLIAHELCHAWLRAEGRSFPGDEAGGREHAEVSSRLHEWGFDEGALQAWADSSGEAIWRRYKTESADEPDPAR